MSRLPKTLEFLGPLLQSLRHKGHRMRMRAAWSAQGMIERFSASGDLPPPALRYRVHGAIDRESFARVGAQCAKDIASALALAQVPSDRAIRVLDFGCGCGRTLIWLRELLPLASFSGTDIDAEAIRWCQRHLPAVETSVNGPFPPLTYAAGSMGAIYAISVFTHLNEEMQFAWLAELERLLAPGGVLILSVLGGNPKSGIGKVGNEIWHGIFPKWYQDTTHSESYVRAEYGRRFEFLHYLPRGMNAHQDVVILRKRSAADQGTSTALPKF